MRSAPTIDHRGVPGEELVRGNRSRPDRVTYRGVCCCGWRSPHRRDTSQEAVHDLEKDHGIITGARGTQTGWALTDAS